MQALFKIVRVFGKIKFFKELENKELSLGYFATTASKVEL